jgi:hypothetical protein
MDRWRVVYRVILLITVLTVPHVHGFVEYAELVGAAILLIVLYNWWRGRGIFRKTS